MMKFHTCFFLSAIAILNGVQADSESRCKRQTGNTCYLMPQATQGPYYWNATYNRPNLTEDRPGIPFTLLITVIEVGTCKPIPKAAIDIWHCDAGGIYSHFVNASLGSGGGSGGPPPPGSSPPQGGSQNNDNSTFLRGLQVTNDNGQATFYTIYPGWYPGRPTHMHIKVHINGTYVDANGVYTGGYVSHTGQLFFNDTFTDTVAMVAPYSSRNITRVLNNIDGIFTGQGGSSSLLSVTLLQGSLQGGVMASITLGINSSSIPDPVAGVGGPMPSNSTVTGNGNTVAIANFALLSFYFILLLLH